MQRKVAGIESQAIPTTQRPPFGRSERVLLELGKGWEAYYEGFFPTPAALNIADHTQIVGAVQHISGTDHRALIVPIALAPFDEYSFFTHREDKSTVVIKVGTDGYIRIPPGAPVDLCFRYPTPMSGA